MKKTSHTHVKAMARRPATYLGKVAQNGNSTSLRLKKGLFDAHPSFETGAEIEATAISDDMLLVRAIKHDSGQDDPDPVISAFLAYIEQDMMDNPQSIQPISADVLDDIAQLVEGVAFDQEG